MKGMTKCKAPNAHEIRKNNRVHIEKVILFSLRVNVLGKVFHMFKAKLHVNTRTF